MTAFIGIVNQDFAIIATDTLSTYPLEEGHLVLRPRSFTCKTFLLPQFKAAFSVTGTLQLGLCFHVFMVERALGIDIDSLINIDLSLLRNELETKYNHTAVGTIYLVGYSYSSRRFKCFKMTVAENSEELIWVEFSGDNIIFKPSVSDWESKISTTGESADYCELITKIMLVQKKEDEEKPVTEQVGIGGEIIYTHLVYDSEKSEIIFVSRIPFKFDDYDSQGERIMLNSLPQ